MSELVVERLNGALGRPAVRRLRVQARRPPMRGLSGAISVRFAALLYASERRFRGAAC